MINLNKDLYKIKQENFTAYNGMVIPFSYRENTNDFNTILSITRDDEYRSREIQYRKGDVFVDIGAHIGTWSSFMSHLVDDSQVIAVEPLPENVEIINMNLLGRNARIVPAAISNISGSKTKIYYADDSEFGMHHKFVGNTHGDHKGQEFFEVETVLLDDILKNIDHVRAMKVDAEGAEHFMFPSVSEETWKKIDYIIGEYHNPWMETGKTRERLFSFTRGLFEDITVDKVERTIGQFWFKRIES